MSKPSKATRTKKPRAHAKKLPAPLAKRVADEVEAKRARLLEQAKADVALIVRRKEIITEAFLDIGAALVRLEKNGAHRLFGKPSFEAFCADELDMSLAKAKELIKITRAPRERALAWGQDRTAALLALADATPEADTAESLSTAKLRLPSGKLLDVAKASAKKVWEAVKEIRAANRTSKPKRGLSVAPEDRKEVERIHRALAASKIPGAGAVAVANYGGTRIRFDQVPLAQAEAFAKALLAALRAGRRASRSYSRE